MMGFLRLKMKVIQPLSDYCNIYHTIEKFFVNDYFCCMGMSVLVSFAIAFAYMSSNMVVTFRDTDMKLIFISWT